MKSFATGVKNEEYHRRTLGVFSNSANKAFRRAPAFYRWWVDSVPEPPTPALEFGSLFHCISLEPDKFKDGYVVQPDFGNLRTNEGKGRRDAWLLQNGHLKPVLQEDVDVAFRMRDALLSHTDARFVIENSIHEVTGIWNDPLTGLECRIRPDCWMAKEKIIGDIKTTIDASEEEFAKAIVNFDYRMQAALYQMGAAEISESDVPVEFVWACVEKKPPFLVATYSLSRDDMAKSVDSLRNDMARFKRCVDEDRWEGFGMKIKEIPLPRWAK